MKIRLAILVIIFSIVTFHDAFSQFPNPNIKVYGYLTTWALQMHMGAFNYENCLYTDIDWDACTDYITFTTAFADDGSMAIANWTDWSNGLKSSWDQSYFNIQKRRILNDYIHSKGKSIQCCFFVNGDGGTWSTLLSTQSGRNAMIKTIVDSVIGSTNRYDGVHFDPEPFTSIDTANARIFFARLRDTLNNYHQWVDVNKKPEMTVAIYGSWCGAYWGTVSKYFDAILHMSYNMFGSWESITWYNAPVCSAGYEGLTYNVASIKDYIDTYTSAGIPRDKLVMACPLNYNAYQGGITSGGEGCYAPLLDGSWVGNTNFPTWINNGSEMYYTAWNRWIDTATMVHRDTIRCAAWIGYNNIGSANDVLVLFQDTFCIRKNLELISSEGLQGAMVWEIPGAYINNLNQIRHPGLANDHLLQAVKKTRLDLQSSTSITGNKYLPPAEYMLHQNYPNPFNSATTIKYQIPQSSFSEKGERGGFVSLKVYDLLGREMATLVNEQKPAGIYTLQWNASNLPSGVYFYQLKAGSYAETKKLVLLK
jgi:GH18 family chitinase